MDSIAIPIGITIISVCGVVILLKYFVNAKLSSVKKLSMIKLLSTECRVVLYWLLRGQLAFNVLQIGDGGDKIPSLSLRSTKLKTMTQNTKPKCHPRYRQFAVSSS